MTRDKDKGEGNQNVGVELKYCEHCGSLWVRERGTGIIYCDRCTPKVADLPVPKRKPGRLVLPVRPATAIEDYEFEIEMEDPKDFEAMGGAA